MKNVSFHKFFLNVCHVVYVIILWCDFYTLLYMISFVDCLFVFALCSCTVSVIGLVAVVPAIINKELNSLELKN